MKRAKRRGFLRSVAVALGNWGSREGAPVLARAVDDPDPVIRGHAAWARGRILGQRGIPRDQGFLADGALLDRKEVEADSWVRGEVEMALLGETEAR